MSNHLKTTQVASDLEEFEWRRPPEIRSGDEIEKYWERKRKEQKAKDTLFKVFAVLTTILLITNLSVSVFLLIYFISE